MRERTVAEWVEAFRVAGAPVAPVNFPEEMSDDPQVAAEGLMVELEHALTGRQRLVGPVIEMSATPPEVRRASPTVGQHSREVLAEWGLAAGEVETLVASGVVA
jgi:crotonobetainyl-CoA:carnitine CoA-transferase CaiB-like acyl-CoA transferase